MLIEPAVGLKEGREKIVAMFHFRLKSDKKPEGTRISPVQHVDYIRHEGNFAEDKQWQENNKFVGNYITSAEVKNVCIDLISLLYKTDNFGMLSSIHASVSLKPTKIEVLQGLLHGSMLQPKI